MLEQERRASKGLESIDAIPQHGPSASDSVCTVIARRDELQFGSIAMREEMPDADPKAKQGECSADVGLPGCSEPEWGNPIEVEGALPKHGLGIRGAQRAKLMASSRAEVDTVSLHGPNPGAGCRAGIAHRDRLRLRSYAMHEQVQDTDPWGNPGKCSADSGIPACNVQEWGVPIEVQDAIPKTVLGKRGARRAKLMLLRGCWNWNLVA